MHPITMQQMVKIHQAELLQEAAEQRAARSAQADNPRGSRRRLAVALALGALAIGLAFLFGVIGAI